MPTDTPHLDEIDVPLGAGPEIGATLSDFDVRRIELRPGDALLVEAPGPMTPARAARLREQAEQAFPGVPLLILDAGATLRILAAWPAPREGWRVLADEYAARMEAANVTAPVGGMCPVCNALAPLDAAGRISEHRPAAPRVSIVCDGAGRYPA